MSNTPQYPDRIRQLSQELFGELEEESLPSADDLLRALELAKGKRLVLSPALLKSAKSRIRCERRQLDCGEDDQICITCDFPNDACDRCDVPDVICDNAEICVFCDLLDGRVSCDTLDFVADPK